MTNMYETVHTMLIDSDEDGKPYTRAAMITAITPNCSQWLHEALIDEGLGMGAEQRALVTRLLTVAVVDTARRSFEHECAAAEST